MTTTLQVTSDIFRQAHRFITPDGRRWKSLICAAQSLVITGPKGGVIVQETKIGERTWDRRYISYEVARMAWEARERAAAVAVLEHPAILQGDSVYDKSIDQ